jgi:hypothetical protein
MSAGKSPEISWQLPEAATDAATPEEIERAKEEFKALFDRLWEVMQAKGLTRSDFNPPVDDFITYSVSGEVDAIYKEGTPEETKLGNLNLCQFDDGRGTSQEIRAIPHGQKYISYKKIWSQAVTRNEQPVGVDEVQALEAAITDDTISYR